MIDQQSKKCGLIIQIKQLTRLNFALAGDPVFPLSGALCPVKSSQDPPWKSYVIKWTKSRRLHITSKISTLFYVILYLNSGVEVKTAGIILQRIVYALYWSFTNDTAKINIIQQSTVYINICACARKRSVVVAVITLPLPRDGGTARTEIQIHAVN